MREFDTNVSKEMFGTEYKGGLLALLDGMTWHLTDVEKVFLYNKLILWPQEVRDEIYELLKFDKFHPKAQNQLQIPDFENINGKSFKNICENNAFKNYCSLSQKIPEIEKLLEVMKEVGAEGTLSRNNLNLDMTSYPKQSSNVTNKLLTVPMCWFGKEADLLLNTPEFTMDQAFAYWEYNKTLVDIALASSLDVS